MGTSYFFECLDLLAWDHPHAYGNKGTAVVPLLNIIGSSPRVWGQVVCGRSCQLNTGIIPTRMGTRNVILPTSRRIWDHPHAYGDKIRIRTVISDLIGSSPRVWGQEKPIVHPYHESRIIPTRMGTSGGSPLRRKIVQDHPHAYGDKRFQLSPAVTVKGSSPRVWGQDISTDTPLADGRIIPTRVGTRLANKNNPTETEDHPHACGDKSNRQGALTPS